jgi:hypothetical protein
MNIKKLSQEELQLNKMNSPLAKYLIELKVGEGIEVSGYTYKSPIAVHIYSTTKKGAPLFGKKFTTKVLGEDKYLIIRKK